MPDLQLHPVSELLLGAAARHRAESWLILGGEASLALEIADAHPESTVFWQPIDAREVGAVLDVPPNLTIQSPGEATGPVAAVAIAATPDRGLARRWLLIARSALVEGGRVFVAGANDEGIRSVIGDGGKILGSALREDYRSKHRVAVFASGGEHHPDPTWAFEAGIAPGTWREISSPASDASIPLVTQAGVFAGHKIDTGTQLLLDAMPGFVSGRVLDVGCGAGVLGIAAAMLGATHVDMTDTNVLAVQATVENIRRLSVPREGERPSLPPLRVFASDVFEAIGEERYDLIVSNPPFHRGKAVDYTVADRLIDEAPEHLAEGGSLLVVANAFLAYGKRMAKAFRDVEAVVATRQFHVLRARGARAQS